jgi:hypothetical protein
MRKLLTGSVTALLALAVLIGPAAAEPAVTPQEWQWMEAASGLVDNGDTAGAVPYWSRLVDSLQTHNPDACGNYAQKLGRALDQAGRYTEAVAAFEAEFQCWGQFSDRAEWVLWDQRRVEQIRPEIRTFVSRPTAPEPTGNLAKNEPAFGMMLGGTIDKDPAIQSDPGRVAAAYGKSYAMVLIYAEWNQPIPVVAFENAHTAGAALQLAWQPGQGLDAVRDDTYVRGIARQLHEYGHPVYLRFGGEMNGSWTQWYGDPAKYMAKFRLIAGIMREDAPNVAMVWSPNFVGDQPWQEYYPGDEWVDWVGVNAYHERYFGGNPATSTTMLEDIYYAGPRTNPLDKLKPLYEAFAGRKPLMLSETGFAWDSRRGTGGESLAWAQEQVRQFYGYLPLVYPRLKAVSYFNVDFQQNPQIPSSSHYLVSARPELARAFREATAPDWFLGRNSVAPQSFWRPMEQASLTGKTRVASYVNLGGGVSRVEYLLDGNRSATATALPWTADVDFGGLTGQHTFTVRAYDKAGSLGYERTYSFEGSAVRVSLNGRYLDFDQPPVMLDSRVLVPARAILEALGAQIGWEAGSQTVVAMRGGSTIRLQIDNPVPLKDGRPLKALDVPAKLIGGRTLVPARFVAENYDMDVSWDEASRTVIIRPKQP